jgi:fructose-1,6-bisphosphatase/sedoheptulose 1,7-bisphosphatase-like protein
MGNISELNRSRRFRTTVSAAARRIGRGAALVGSEIWEAIKNRPMVPGVLSIYAPLIRRLGVRTVEGLDFKPIELSKLLHLKESMAPVLDAYSLELMDVQEHVYQPAVRAAGPISSLNGPIAPKILAQNAVAAYTVKTNGAETGKVDNYNSVKTFIDGIGATITNNALEIAGKILSKLGFHFVTVATEGTATHSKPGESPLGNPTIPQGKLFPESLPLAKEPVGTSGKIYRYQGSNPIYILLDVVEGTEITSTTLEAYQAISTRAGQPKDNGGVCLIAAYDQPAIVADTYVDKFIVSPRIANALKAKGLRLSLDEPLEVSFQKIAEAAGRPVSDLSVMGLGVKPRVKKGKVENDRPGRIALINELKRLGVEKNLFFDDGESTAVGLMVKQTEVAFDNGAKGSVDIFLGPGGAVESVTACRTVADACEDGAQEYAAVWGYVSKNLTKKPATYFDMHKIPEDELGPYKELGIDPRGTRSISETVPDDGDRLFVLSSITSNPRLNPAAIAPDVNHSDNAVTVYQEVVSSDGSVVGRYLTFRAKVSIQTTKNLVYPVLPDIMKTEDLEELKGKLTELKKSPESMEALRTSLRMYLYSLVEKTYDPDKPPFYLKMGQLLLRRVINTVDDQKAMILLRFLTTERPDWFVNPNAVADSKAIVNSRQYTIETDGEGNPVAIIPNNENDLFHNGDRTLA